MQDVDAPEGVEAGPGHGAAVVLAGDVGADGGGLAAFGLDEGAGFLGGFGSAVGQQNACAFAGEEDGGGAAVADGLAGGLSGAGDDGHLFVESIGHGWVPRG